MRILFTSPKVNLQPGSKVKECRPASEPVPSKATDV